MHWGTEHFGLLSHSFMSYCMRTCQDALCVWQMRPLSNIFRPTLKNIPLLTDVTEKRSCATAF
jgi:hypothetical protein